MHAEASWCVLTRFRRACEGNQIVSSVGGWEGAVFISGIRAYEISDDVTKFYTLRKISDVTRCDNSASRIHASVTLSV